MAGPNPGGGGGGGSSSLPGMGSPGTGSGTGIGIKTNPLDQYAPSTRKTETRLTAVEKILADQPASASAMSVQMLTKRFADLAKVVADLVKQMADLTKRLGAIESIPPVVGGAEPTIEASDEVETLVAADTLPAFVVATILGARADSANVAHFGKVVGVTAESIAPGFSGRIELSGILLNEGWAWTAGAEVFLNGNALSMTPPSTGFVQQIGIAKGPTLLYVDIQEPILL